MHQRARVTGIANKSLRALMTGLLGGATYSMNQASYDLARRPTNGLITPHPGHEPLSAHRRRAAVCDRLHQAVRPAAAPAACHQHHYRYEKPCTP
jgi:hypothetical protein